MRFRRDCKRCGGVWSGATRSPRPDRCVNDKQTREHKIPAPLVALVPAVESRNPLCFESTQPAHWVPLGVLRPNVLTASMRKLVASRWRVARAGSALACVARRWGSQRMRSITDNARNRGDQRGWEPPERSADRPCSCSRWACSCTPAAASMHNGSVALLAPFCS